MPSPPPPAAPAQATRRRTRRGGAALLALLALLTLLSGCSRVRAALAVQPDDTVRGELVVATPTVGPEDRGPVVTVPPGLDVDLRPYRADGYTGTRVLFSDLSFEEVSRLTEVATLPDGRVQFAMRRAGNRVLAEGSVDLAGVSANRADFQLKITFPGQVLETDGDAEGTTVTWTFEPDQKGEIRAVASYVDPHGPSLLLWTTLLTLLVAAAAGGVVWLARQDRNPPVVRARR
ncbi:MAG: DUF3153 domain-containing protein [Pseudonocardia sp.]